MGDIDRLYHPVSSGSSRDRASDDWEVLTVDETKGGLVDTSSDSVRVDELATRRVNPAAHLILRGRDGVDVLSISHRIVDGWNTIKLLNNLEVYTISNQPDDSHTRSGGSGRVTDVEHRRWFVVESRWPL